MKTLLIIALIFFSIISSGKIWITTTDNCTDWQSFLLSDGTKTNLHLRFCSLSESTKDCFEIRNDNDLDAKLLCKINFKNGKKTTHEVVIHHNGKTSVEFSDNAINFQSGISSWLFDQIQYGECGSFNATNKKN